MQKAGRPDLMRLAATGVPIGMFEDMAYTDASVTMEAGDALVLHTDGLVENRNASGIALGEEGLARVIAGAGGTSTRDLLTRLLTVCDQHLAGVEARDDVTVVVATRTA